MNNRRVTYLTTEDDKLPCGRDIYLSPEFKALCALLGIDHAAKTVDIEIRLTLDSTRIIQRTLRPYEELEVGDDTTSLHNVVWTTRKGP